MNTLPMPTRTPSHARCRCRTVLRFTTDAIGRTLECCDGCGYCGPVRRVAKEKPGVSPRQRVRKTSPVFGCGHTRSPENSYHHPRGWLQCRECTLARTRAWKARWRAA